MQFVFGDFLYFSPIRTLRAFHAQELQEAFEQLEAKEGYWVGYLTYESYQAFQAKTITSDLPLMEFTLFKHRTPYEPKKSQNVFVPEQIAWLDYEDYAQKIKVIKEQIAQGNTYQSNLTTLLHFHSSLGIEEIFTSLLCSQNTPYKALLNTPYRQIASFSPELFFQIKNNIIQAEPMKGTIGRGANPQEDQVNAEFLQKDIKNRSENVMIVDLLRNDLSKIASNVKVPELFKIHTYPTLFQMTSRIEGELKPNTTLYQVFQALFPCGSITGAPKKRTMEILDSLEEEPRGVYCGAIGMISTEEIVFSIPIRTIVRQNGKYVYGVGSGVVWDSQAKEEYQELQTKMRFLSPEFELVETLLFEKGEWKFLPQHLERLKASAHSLGFYYPEGLENTLTQTSLTSPHIGRIQLSKNGEFRLQTKPLEENLSNAIELEVREGKSDLMHFKSTFRPWYQNAMQKIQENAVFDVIFHTLEGELLEGARSNLVLQIENVLYTPPLQGGILNGIYRQTMLKKGQLQERKLFLEDLLCAQKIFCINSVRGMVEVTLRNRV